jgi:NADH:ubiquinone oxidoreductase subunit 3 (subunit A)
VIFAVEIAFLFPWALVLGDAVRDQGAAAGMGIGVFALLEGVLFIVILFLGWRNVSSPASSKHSILSIEGTESH